MIMFPCKSQQIGMLLFGFLLGESFYRVWPAVSCSFKTRFVCLCHLLHGVEVDFCYYKQHNERCPEKCKLQRARALMGAFDPI